MLLIASCRTASSRHSASGVAGHDYRGGSVSRRGRRRHRDISGRREACSVLPRSIGWWRGAIGRDARASSALSRHARDANSRPVQPRFSRRSVRAPCSGLVSYSMRQRDVIPADRPSARRSDAADHNAETLDATITTTGQRCAADAVTTSFAVLAHAWSRRWDSTACCPRGRGASPGIRHSRRSARGPGVSHAPGRRRSGTRHSRRPAIGLATSWWLAKFLEDRLFGISRFDPISFAGAAGDRDRAPSPLCRPFAGRPGSISREAAARVASTRRTRVHAEVACRFAARRA